MFNAKNTTLYGILAFVAIVIGEVKFLFDDLPGTNPDWFLVISALLVLLGLKAAKSEGSIGGDTPA